MLDLLRRPGRADFPPIAAAIGFFAAVPALLGSPAAPRIAVPRDDVALVNGRPVLRADYVGQVESETGRRFDRASPAQRAQILHEMIDEELAVQDALAQDLPYADIDVRQALVSGVEAQVNAPILGAPAPEAALRAYYAAHRSALAVGGTMRIRNLVLPVSGFRNADQTASQAMQDAGEAAARLRAGDPIDTVMAHYGMTDAPQADPGDQFDFAAKLHLGDELYAIAKSMNGGDVSDPQPQPDGVHLLVMLGRSPPRVPAFEQVLAAVYTAYRQAQQKRAQADTITFLRQTGRILIAPGFAE